MIKWAALIKRWMYSVPISRGFIIHGAVHGYSRDIVYLHCSTNNKKETVLKLFEEAIADYGDSSRNSGFAKGVEKIGGGGSSKFDGGGGGGVYAKKGGGRGG